VFEGETALIGYAGAAFVISPLTHDPATIMALLPGLHPNIMPVPGSRADLAIKLASDLLGRSKVDNGHIIWVTDGIDGQDFSAIESAAGWNILSILAVGTETGSPITLSGGGFLKDKNGAIVIPKLNTQPLKKLANQAHGSFSILSTDDLDVERIISAETFADEFVEDKRKRTSDKWNEEGPWLVLLALPFVAMVFRRGVLFVWVFVVLLGHIAMPYSALAFEWNDLWQRSDQQAAELLRKGETNKAAQRFENPEWKGTAAYRSGDYEKAIEQFSQQDHPRANFNRGNALAFAGRLQAALDAFKQVLAENPQDEDAQYNHDLIEKLLKEQQNKQQKEQHQEGKQGRKEENKQNHPYLL
jgi:Ca-activated chloride channel family protein